MKALAKKEREQIFGLFLKKERLKFSDIEKAVGVRSNMVAYHLEQMRREGLLEKKGEHYAVTRGAERFIPVLSHITGQDQSPLPVILIAPLRKRRVFLVQRDKRPYKDYLSLVGGKMLFGETLEDACRRKLATYGLVPSRVSLCAVANERVEEDGEVKHHFLLFFVKCAAEERSPSRKGGEWLTVSSLQRQRIIPSDLWLLQHRLGASAELKNILMHEKEGILSSFRIEQERREDTENR